MRCLRRCFRWMNGPMRDEKSDGPVECEFYQEGRQGEGLGKMLGGPKFRSRCDKQGRGLFRCGRGRGLGRGRNFE